jgi:hypothetical protein
MTDEQLLKMQGSCGLNFEERVRKAQLRSAIKAKARPPSRMTTHCPACGRYIKG